MTPELWTVIIDFAATLAAGVVGFWVAPQYREFAVGIIAGLQGVAAAFVVHFRSERKIAALGVEIKMLRR